MSINRVAALAFLAGEYPTIASAVGITNTDDAAGYGTAIDAALRALGIARADLPTATIDDADEGKYVALLRYWGVNRLKLAAVPKYSVGIPGPIRADRSDIFKALAVCAADALAALRIEGITPSGVSTFRRVRIGQDKLEPAPTA